MEPRTDLRHNAARRGAVAGHLAERDREARDRPPARAAERRHHRSRLPDRLARRLRGGAGDRARGRRPGHRRPGAREPGGRRSCMGGRQGRGATSHPHVRLDVRHPHRVPAAVHPGGRARGSRERPSPRPRRCATTSSSPRWTPPERTGSSPPRSSRSPSTRARRPSTSRTPSATPCRTSTPPSSPTVQAGPGAGDVVLSRPLPRRPGPRRGELASPASRPARGRSSAPSTASASARATRRSRRS